MIFLRLNGPGTKDQRRRTRVENICQAGKGKGSLGSHSHFRGKGRQGDEANSLALMILKDVQLSVTGQIDSDRPSFENDVQLLQFQRREERRRRQV